VSIGVFATSRQDTGRGRWRDGLPPAYKVVKREKKRWWEVRDTQGELVCVTVYKRGAVKVARRLAA
jgi:hypothetical protein